MRPGRGHAALAGAVAAAWTAACANQGAPPGGAQDLRPPVIFRTEPDTFAVVSDLQSRVRFHFDERISESVANGTLVDAVTVSPQSGEVRVSHGSQTITVEVEGGLRSGVVYRVTLLPVVRDLFGNQLRDPFELVFSTGGTPSPTTLAGQVWDRTTGRGLQQALVHARGVDSLVHVAAADEEGIFAFRYLPSGSFVVTGFEDQDRNRAIGPRETTGSIVIDVAVGDTAFVDIAVLPPDTTAAVVARATVLDSLTFALEFDDFLDPDAQSADVRVALASEVGSAPAVRQVFHDHEYQAYAAQVRDSLAAAQQAATAAAAPPALDSAAAAPPALDSAAAAAIPAAPDSAAAPTGAVPPSGAAPPAGGPPSLGGGGGAEPRRGPGGLRLPARRLVFTLDTPVAPGSYDVTVSGVVNIHGLQGGGGETVLRVEAPAPVPEPPADDAPPDGAPTPGGPPTPDGPPTPPNDGR